jgi:uncharacterized protein involved in exopolysaccharide biosynthesis
MEGKMEEKTLLYYYFALYRKRVLIIITVITAVITASIISKTLAPVYEAEALFFIPQLLHRGPSLTSVGEESLSRFSFIPEASEQLHAPYLGILKSRTIVELVHQEFPDKKMEKIKRDVDFKLSDEFMISVFSRDKDPILAAEIANSFVNNFNVILSNYYISNETRDQEMILEEIEETKKKLDKARRAQNNFQRENNIADLDAETEFYISRKSELQILLKKAEIKINENKSKIAALRQQIEKEASAFSSAGILVNSEKLDSLKTSLATNKQKLERLKVRSESKKNREYYIQNKIRNIEQEMNNEILRILKAQIKAPGTFYGNIRQQLVELLVDEQVIKTSIEAYRKAIEEINKKIAVIPSLLAMSDKLEAEIQRNKKVIEHLEISSKEKKMQAKKNVRMAVVVDEATKPDEPTFPNLNLNIIVAIAVSLIGGIIYAFAIDYTEKTKEQRMLQLLKQIENIEKEK